MKDILDEQIEALTNKLEALRAEFDRLDANHPAQSVQVAQDIKVCAKKLERLIAFRKLMYE